MIIGIGIDIIEHTKFEHFPVDHSIRVREIVVAANEWNNQGTSKEQVWYLATSFPAKRSINQRT